jgi:hypothetical protein
LFSFQVSRSLVGKQNEFKADMSLIFLIILLFFTILLCVCPSGTMTVSEKLEALEMNIYIFGKLLLLHMLCCRFERVLGLCADILKRNITQYNSFVSLSV